jgi:hypothetical protein
MRVHDFVVDIEIGSTPIDPFVSLFGLLGGGQSSSFLGLLSGSHVLVEAKLSALQAFASAQHRGLVVYRCQRDDDSQKNGLRNAMHLMTATIFIALANVRY